MKKTSSLVWRIFDRVEDNNQRCVAVLCKLCETQYKYFGNTTNLRTHLVNKHPIQWELLQNGTLDDSTIRLDEDDSTNQSSTTPRRKRFVKSYKENNVDVLENSETENEGHVELHDDSIIRQMHSTQASDEEWLNEEVYEEVEYQPKHKKPKFRCIKREKQSPPRIPEKYKVVQHHNYSKPSQQRVIVSPRKDDYSVFGEYIGNRLRRLKNPQTRSNVQQLISTIIWQAEYGLYDNIDNVKRVLLSSVQDMMVVHPAELPVHEETVPAGTDIVEN